MVRVGLTGGIASGKSVVANELAKLGAEIIDSDVLARKVVEPGTEGLKQVVERFGPSVLGEDGSLNRPRLGEIIFNDETARADLNSITHPLIRALARELDCASTKEVVVHVVPLLTENQLAKLYDKVVVVDIEPKLQLARLMKRNGLTKTQAESRISAQASRADRLKIADYVIDNSSGLDETRRQVQELWVQLTAT